MNYNMYVNTQELVINQFETVYQKINYNTKNCFLFYQKVYRHMSGFANLSNQVFFFLNLYL